MKTENQFVVCIKNVHKAYDGNKILKNISMTVKRGTIYGLLGASGCGKTTLLNAVLNQIKIDSGKILTFGHAPGSVESRIPGTRVGYMPQNLALIGELSVKDTIFYFGQLMNMEQSAIEERFQELSDLLELPESDTLLSECSGGQQRRVSFAAAIVHKPELLILDEPTAGVDPLIRHRIWNHLTNITQKYGTTVIITTHYIEEAKFANTVGLLRDGKLLAEESPFKLMEDHHTATLEEAFLILIKTETNENSNSNDSACMEKNKNAKTNSISQYGFKKYRFKTQLSKNWKQFYRNKPGVLFQFIFPIFETALFLLCIGGDPKKLPLGVINNDAQCTSNNLNDFFHPDDGYCHLNNISCRFLTFLDHPMIETFSYHTLTEANDDIKHGKIIGVLNFAKDFTRSLEGRINNSTLDLSDQDLDSSEIKVWMDMSNRQLGGTLKMKLYQLYQDFQKVVSKGCNFFSKASDSPLNFHQYLYGDINDPYSFFITPAVLITMLYFMGTIITSTVILYERLEGIWDRSIVAGVTSTEIILSHFVLQASICLFHTIEVITIGFLVMPIEHKGSIALLWSMMYSQSIIGMSYGFWISTVSKNYETSHNLTSGSFFLLLCVSGYMWPLEGMPKILQFVSNVLPFARPIDAFRNIIRKGLTITHFQVWIAFVVSFSWTLVFILSSLYIIKRQRL